MNATTILNLAAPSYTTIISFSFPIYISEKTCNNCTYWW